MNGTQGSRVSSDIEGDIYTRPRGQGWSLARKSSAATEFFTQGKRNLQGGDF